MNQTQSVFSRFSIIIPHKDIQDLLQRCLDSIPLREDVEVIVVDDNSDPRKVDFEHFPRWKGKHYQYFQTKEGKGAGYARNVGLDHAQGGLSSPMPMIFSQRISTRFLMKCLTPRKTSFSSTTSMFCQRILPRLLRKELNIEHTWQLI